MPLNRRIAAILNPRGQSRASQQKYGKETGGKYIKREAEARPPHGYSGILNELVMKEVENSVSSKRSYNHPKTFLESCHG